MLKVMALVLVMKNLMRKLRRRRNRKPRRRLKKRKRSVVKRKNVKTLKRRDERSVRLLERLDRTFMSLDLTSQRKKLS
jgi:hypothetical protein